MVYNYDIYYKTGPKSVQSYRITSTGIPGTIYNGVPDWLYEGNDQLAKTNLIELILRVEMWLSMSIQRILDPQPQIVSGIKCYLGTQLDRKIDHN
jgi:hypothetical protein